MPNTTQALTPAVLAAISLAGAAVQPALADVPAVAPSSGGAAAALAPPVATAARVKSSGTLVRVVERKLQVRSGERTLVRAKARGHDVTVTLRAGKGGRVLDRNRVDAGERFRLDGRAKPGTKLYLSAAQDGHRASEPVAVGQVRRLRAAVASWYGPGLYGNRTACGQRLTPGLRGVAHKTLPCGTRVTIRHGGRTTHARVIDRGPFHGAREFDLTNATARAVGFRHVGRIWVTR